MVARKHRSPPSHRLDLYSGQVFEGYLINRAGRWQAFTADNELIGTFPTMIAAANAVAGAVARSNGEVAA
jgi:hypothetical protein